MEIRKGVSIQAATVGESCIRLQLKERLNSSLDGEWEVSEWKTPRIKDLTHAISLIDSGTSISEIASFCWYEMDVLDVESYISVIHLVKETVSPSIVSSMVDYAVRKKAWTACPYTSSEDYHINSVRLVSEDTYEVIFKRRDSPRKQTFFVMIPWEQYHSMNANASASIHETCDEALVAASRAIGLAGGWSGNHVWPVQGRETAQEIVDAFERLCIAAWTPNQTDEEQAENAVIRRAALDVFIEYEMCHVIS